VSPDFVDRFVESFIATFGGTSTKKVVTTVTPTSSSTTSQLIMTPVGTLSVFGYTTPIPYPFGNERTGYLVRDLDAAIAEARAAGAAITVASFADPIGRDAVIQWPGGVSMQLYWHTSPPTYPALASIPENRVYVAPEKATEFVRDFCSFARGDVVSDEAAAPGVEIGRRKATYRRVRIESAFGRMVVLVTNGQLPFPYGREISGYQVDNVAATLKKAKRAGASVLVEPYTSEGREAAIVAFPGGFVAEIHALVTR
jgi:predicted enzyme related to lactoylglutathione lyase